MSGTRFARSGRCRFFISLGALVLMFVMVAIFHSSQQQLDETRAQRMRCEQQQDSLNIRLQAIVEQKYNIEKTLDRERKEQMEKNKNLEQTVKFQKELILKEKADTHARSEKLQQNLKHLQTEHNQLAGECTKAKKKHTEETNVSEKKLELLNSNLQKERIAHNDSIVHWKEKYTSILHEKEHFELLANGSNLSLSPLQHRISELEKIVDEYKSSCDHKLNENSNLYHYIKPANPKPETNLDASSSDRPAFQKPLNFKSFNAQELVSPDLYRILVIKTNKTLNASTAEAILTEQLSTNNKSNVPADLLSTTIKSFLVDEGNSSFRVQKVFSHDNLQLSLPFSARNNHSLIINSVENFQIVPKPITKLSEETEMKYKERVDFRGKGASSPIGQATEHSNKELSVLAISDKKTNSTVSNSSLAPSASVPLLSLRKLPDNVAPIPENFDDLPKNEFSDKGVNNRLKSAGYGADIDAAVEDLQKNDNENNHYSNINSDLEQKAKLAAAVNEDSGAHEIKDREFMNERNFNLPPDENFFENGGKNGAADEFNKHKAHNDDNDDDDDMLGAAIVGGAAVGDHNDAKNHNSILEADGLNNEVLRDQGKEFPDGLHIEDGNDEDEDEDDYSNPALRQQGAQAIRN